MINYFSKLFYLFLLSVCLSNFSYAKEHPRGINVIKETGGYKVEFSLPDYFIKDIFAGNNKYLNLEIPDFGEPLDIGRPKLPQISFCIMLAYEEQNPVINVSSQIQELQLLSNKIYPVQPPILKNQGLGNIPFVLDTNYYKSSGNFNGPFIKVSESFIIAGAKGIMITVCPFAYNPSTNQLKVTKTGSFKIKLQNEPVLRNIPTPDFNKFYNSIFLNYIPFKTTGTKRYLIITAPEYESGLTPLATEKQNLNYIVSVVNTNVTGTTNTAIKNYLQNLYNNVNTRPEFVLLVGDVDKIPEWIGTGIGTPHTDLYYSLLEGSDFYADVFLGRFPIQNTIHLSNMINKTLYMESAINSLPKKNVLCASNDFWPVAEETHNFCIDSFFIPSVYSNIKLYCHTYNATTQQLTDALNSNQLFALYTGHGSETAWGDGPPFNQSNVNALVNTVFPYVYSFSCLTGSYHFSSECFGETWVRGLRGAVVFWGASTFSYLEPDDILQKRIFRAMFIEHLTKTSPSYVLGKFLLSQYYGGPGGPYGTYVKGYLEMYNCLGDPSIFMDGYGPKIVHNPLVNTENLAGPYTVNCTITQTENPVNLSNTKILWTRGTVFTDSISLNNISGNNFTANIPGNGLPAIYRYYIKASDNQNISSVMPIGAPANYYTFTACTDTVKPVIIHTPLSDKLKSLWPATVYAKVTDNIGVDSVWVTWYINTPMNGLKYFRLTNTSGNNYSGVFNSTQSEVNFNDTIKYRTFAKDVSAAQNADSTVLNSFAISNHAIINVGNGTHSSAYPFSTYYTDGRTQILYLESEIAVSDFSNVPKSISKIGFNVISNSPQLMHGFNIRMQNSAATSLSGFINSGWTTCYSGTYSVSGTGWKYIELTTPFIWDGTSNLLLEVCFDNTSWSYYSYVYATENAFKTWAIRNDNTSGCTMSAGNAELYRPNISLVMSQPVNIRNISGNIPVSYSLSQNYPNPFNPSTRINFDILKQGKVLIKVYDILGREVKTLINDFRAPGKYAVDFNGDDLPSGIYFYKLVSEEFTAVKKMVLLK